MKDLHKGICAILLIVAVVWVYHMMTAHQGMSLIPSALGPK